MAEEGGGGHQKRRGQTAEPQLLQELGWLQEEKEEEQQEGGRGVRGLMRVRSRLGHCAADDDIPGGPSPLVNASPAAQRLSARPHCR